MYCENIPTYIKSHLNSKYAIDFFLFFSFFTRNETENKLSVLAKNALYYQNKQCFGVKRKIKFDSMGVILMGQSSFHAAYGTGDFLYCCDLDLENLHSSDTASAKPVS